MGSAELDFTAADIAYPVVDIDLDIGGGSVEVRLHEGASASIDGVHATFGSAEDHRLAWPRTAPASDGRTPVPVACVAW